MDEDSAEDLRYLSDAVLAGAEDLNKAVGFVVEHAADYQVDPKRIVLGGFSAGAVTSLNVAHGMKAPVAGAFMLSTAPICLPITKVVTRDSNSPPVLIFLGQNDLGGALAAAPPLVAHYRKVALDLTFAWVPAYGHFYPAGAASLGADGTRASVEQRILEFVDRVAGK